MQGRPSHESGDDASAAQAREEAAKDPAQTECRIKSARQSYCETPRSLLARSSQPKEADRLEKDSVSHPVSAP